MVSVFTHTARVFVSLQQRKWSRRERHLVAAGRAVATEATATTLDGLDLGNGDDVDGDGVELFWGLSVFFSMYKLAEHRCAKLTPRCLRRSLVSVSTSS